MRRILIDDRVRGIAMSFKKFLEKILFNPTLIVELFC